MPSRHRGKSRRRMRGRGKIMDFVRKAVGFLRRTKIVSKVANFAGQHLPGQYGAIAGPIGRTADKVGFGRRRRYGRGLRLAGM